MNLRTFLSLAALFFLTGVSATPIGQSGVASSAAKAPGTKCTSFDDRKEWRDLTIEQRLSYINAVLCLHKLPPRDPTRAATSRYEEFQATHILLTDRVHSVGHFLPWHRHLGTLYGNALREECGYNGPTAYWDWSRDADVSTPILESPIFDPVTGFGGDGVPGTYTLPPDPKNESAIGPFPGFGGRIWKGCVMDGPFKDTVFHLGPGRMITDHCLVRGVDDQWKRMLTSENVKNMLKARTYEEFRLVIDAFNGIHGGGHILVGGEMTNTYSAGADPLFYLHHANLDRVWWHWQQADPANRLYDLSGPTTKGGNIPITLDFELDFPALGPNITVRDTMDSSLEPNCFTYE
ncbi:hypothetical protein MD484_g5409, partial [Candolleomyces efflorescens]